MDGTHEADRRTPLKARDSADHEGIRAGSATKGPTVIRFQSASY
jgi:hypothetical protein